MRLELILLTTVGNNINIRTVKVESWRNGAEEGEDFLEWLILGISSRDRAEKGKVEA